MAIAQLCLLNRVRFGYEPAKLPVKIRGDDQDRHDRKQVCGSAGIFLGVRQMPLESTSDGFTTARVRYFCKPT